MKKLSDFTGKEASKAAGVVFQAICDILKNKKNKAVYNKEGASYAIGAALVNTPEAIIQILSVLNDKKPEEFEYDGATLLEQAFSLFEDPAIARLFGLQS